MKIRYVVSGTLVGVVFLFGMLLGAVMLRDAWAAPDDVRGSGNVAVAGYRNSRGSFVLWSSGRITTLAGQEANSASAYDTVQDASLPRRITGEILGARRVAVGIVPNELGTYVLFSDGTVAKPRSADAAAAKQDSVNMLYGVTSGSGAVSGYCSSSGWSASKDYSQKNSTYAYRITIRFYNSFKKAPVVMLSSSGNNAQICGVTPGLVNVGICKNTGVVAGTGLTSVFFVAIGE